MRVALLCVLLFISSFAQAAPAEETWMSVTLDGRKIGHLLNRREVLADRVVTSQSMEVRIDRGGIGIGMQTSETSEETLDGKPLGFRARSQLSGMETLSQGTFADGKLSIQSSVGGISQNKTMDWPAGAQLAEGLRLAAMRHGLKAGTTYKDLAFQPSSQDAIAVTTTVKQSENVDLPGGRRRLVRVEQEMSIPGLPITSTAWVDDKYNLQKMVMPLLGLRLEMLACDRTCAQAPNQSADMLQNTLLHAPRPLQSTALSSGLRYTLRPRDATRAIDLPDTDEQQVQRDGQSIRLSVAAQPRASGKNKPDAADTAATAWLQADAPDLVALARQAAGSASDDLQRMQAMESFVHRYIEKKNLSVGYASALETLQSREGDCTEHALLLAALGRASKIPTRVVTGLAYTDSFGGAERVFVPHAWVQAWVNGRWQSFDAALGGFDSGHIALGVGDGDPWRFYAGIGTLGNIQLDKVEPLTPNP